MIYLAFILLLLIIILIIKLYLDISHKQSKILSNQSSNQSVYKSSHKSSYKDNDSNNNVLTNAKYNRMLEDMQTDTARKINFAVEQGYTEGFRAMTSNAVANADTTSDSTSSDTTTEHFSNSNRMKRANNANNDVITSYLNKGDVAKLMLFYKIKCTYCAEFLPIWYQIVNNLPNTIMYEEIECDKEYKKATENNITSTPTLILIVNNEKKIYMGDRSYRDVSRFLKNNGINLVERTFEEFDSTGYSNAPEPTQQLNAHCPAVTFDKKLDVAKDEYMFQIFNSDGQYGYAVGGNNAGKILTPFTAAYSTLDSYLLSLPDTANMNECANLYSSEIRGFGLCDNNGLNSMLSYQKKINNGTGKIQFDGTDYSTNVNVVNALKQTCQL